MVDPNSHSPAEGAGGFAFDKIAKRRMNEGMRGMPTERARRRMSTDDEGAKDDDSPQAPASKAGNLETKPSPKSGFSDDGGHFIPSRRSAIAVHTPVYLPADTPRQRMLDNSRAEKSERAMWVAIVVTVVIALTAAGLVGYILQLNLDNDNLRTARDTLAEKLSGYPSLEEIASMQSGIAPMGEVHGWLVLRASDGTRVPASTVTVKVFRNEDIKEFLSESAPKLLTNTPNDLGLRMSMSSLPDPVASTITNQIGAFNVKLPEMGRYVIFSEVSVQHSGKYFAWLLEFDSRDEINTPVELSPANAIKSYDPRLMLREAR